jgi:tetratricopeptide (TPR) repeat protein
VKILQNFVLNLGFEKNYILTGFKISDEFSSLDCGFKYNFNNKNYDYIISYVKSIGEINKEVSAQKEIQIKEREKVSEKVLEKQKELIEEGLLYYRQNDYKKAKEIWENAYKLAPDSKYGREAKKYIERVNKILKQIGE